MEAALDTGEVFLHPSRMIASGFVFHRALPGDLVLIHPSATYQTLNRGHNLSSELDFVDYACYESQCADTFSTTHSKPEPSANWLSDVHKCGNHELAIHTLEHSRKINRIHRVSFELATRMS
jgi:hypothetical protein